MKHYWNKKGIVKNDYGEVSIELFVNESFEIPFDRSFNDDSVSLFFEIPIQESAACIKECLRILKENDDAGISFAKTRAKYHVEVSICKHKQFIGQYKTIALARAAKVKFLNDFMNAVLDAAIPDEDA